MFSRSSRGRPESTFQARTLDARLGRLHDIISRRHLDDRWRRPRDFSLGRPRDCQIGSSGDVLGTFNGDVLGTFWGPIFAVGFWILVYHKISECSLFADPSHNIYIRALSKHFCWPPFFMKDWVFREVCAPERFGCFTDLRFSNRLVMHHSVTKYFLFLGLFLLA